MQFSGFSRYESGVILPVSALRSEKSLGIGEFADLPLLGSWCSEVDLRFIQILPVNDTGTESSPYSALSAFALHPVYLRLEDLPEFDPSMRSVLEKERKRLSGFHRIPFAQVVQLKEQFLSQIFTSHQKELCSSNELVSWAHSNPWVLSYAAFRLEKRRHQGKAWTEWNISYPGDEVILHKLHEGDGELFFYVWVQKRLEDQFVQAAHKLDRMGLCLKGDLPILMGDDSADVWAFSHLFHRTLRAGAPPDMFSRTGQNWGFPIYNWEALEAEGYRWWKERLRRADLFYHAFRIDHVLGFFRIWALPEKESSGVLGFYFPSSFFSKEDLIGEGMDWGRIRWLSEPHIRGEEVRSFVGKISPGLVDSLFQQIGNEDLFLFKPEIGERYIERHISAGEIRDKLLELYRNRFFLETPYGYAPAWYRDSARALGVLRAEEREKLQSLVAKYYRSSEVLWEQVGEKLLRVLKETTGMLPCAEDLGVVPDCVPKVLGRLGVLGLRIPRWTRRYKEAGYPFIPPKEYPRLSVCATSVHDTSTLRQWWEEEPDRDAFWKSLGYTGSAPVSYNISTAEKVLYGILESSSLLVMVQLQDLFALSRTYRVKDPTEERINIPGTVSDRNWTYRLPFLLEEFTTDTAFKEKVRGLLKDRSSRTVQ
ncbi:MAG: 4-alpha-glucanotransferase [Spirochaetes bacterium]|nr:4-alpha-glucanotransferase [Spirochaetota bacterium]